MDQAVRLARSGFGGDYQRHGRNTLVVTRFTPFLVALLAACTAKPAPKPPPAPASSQVTDTIDFNSLSARIRDRQSSLAEAQPQIRLLLPQLATRFHANGGAQADSSNWRFPLAGYTAGAIGGSNGSGYIANGYDYFDGDAHKGHPAHDIFIADRNQDAIDDVTRKPVPVLSISPGIVVAMATTWDSTSSLRGGRYIWIYDPNSGSLFYYAHNSDVLVRLLDIVNAGDTIATVGRTGFNAYPKRSPTHLHVMRLVIDSTGVPRPVNLYRQLMQIGGAQLPH